MKCPYCSTTVKVNYRETFIASHPDQLDHGYEVAYGTCPQCSRPIVVLREGRVGTIVPEGIEEYAYPTVENIEHEEIIYPKHATRSVEMEVPDDYRTEFLEACSVVQLSPKASAALSRRLLQAVLREEFNIKHGSLAKEIEDFIQREDVPPYLSKAVDAIRNIGNLAAHPIKDTSTGEIVDVEPGEAEWLLEVLESLFDFAFVQPKRLEERRQKLNEKLRALGKPPMKS
jgi:hypothetical protein